MTDVFCHLNFFGLQQRQKTAECPYEHSANGKMDSLLSVLIINNLEALEKHILVDDDIAFAKGCNDG